MLAVLPDAPGVTKRPGRFPDDTGPLPELAGRADAVLCYSVLHYVFAGRPLIPFLDAALAMLKPGSALLLGDLPNASMRRRFLAGAAGRTFHRTYSGRHEDPDLPIHTATEGEMDDSVLLSLVARARARGFDAWLVPQAPADDPILATRVAGLALPNPIGLAAGFDKDVMVPDAMLRLGFGFVECGSVTPRPQEGNPKPRIFRLVEDAAVINRLGFNNRGLEHAVVRLQARRSRPGIVGINLGANKESQDRTADYVTGVRAAAAHGTRTHAGRPARTHALPRPFCVEFKLGVFKKKI
jgi:hypothetical protein